VLDEIGELPMPVQAKLLRALADGEMQPVGSGKTERIDARIVACTNRDLAREAETGRFRADLYYRLAVVELVVPPLLHRREDIPALIDAFRIRYAARFGLDDVRFTPALVDALTARDWPGNVRELENAVARLLALSDGGTLNVDALEGATSSALAELDTSGAAAPLRARMAAFERGLIERTMADAGGNQSEAARRLKITRVTLIDKLKRHGLMGRR